jgi:hypothetical protein
MKTFEFKTLMLVAAVACLPIACGTSSVTGPDAASLVGPQGTVSALRSIDPLPPTVPPQDPNSEPAPQVPTSDGVPEVGGGGHTNQPAHQPAPGTDPNQTDPHGLPGVSPDPGPVPAPAQCLAASIEISKLDTFASTPGVALEAILFDEKHVAITDSSCDKLDWRVEATDGNIGPGTSTTAAILYGPDTRYVSVIGPAGVYKVGVTAPNGAGNSLLIALQ